MNFWRYIILIASSTILMLAENKTPRLDAIEEITKEMYNTVIENKTMVLEEKRKISMLQKQLLAYMQLQQKKQPKSASKSDFYPSDINEMMQSQSSKISKLYNYIYLLLFAITALAGYIFFFLRRRDTKTIVNEPYCDVKLEQQTSPTDESESKKMKKSPAGEVSLDEADKKTESIEGSKEETTAAPIIDPKEYLEFGISSFGSGDYEAALGSFEKGIAEAEENSSLLAELCLAKAVTFDALGESSKAVDTYDMVIKEFKGTADGLLQEQVARAMVSKGATLGKMTESKKAIRTYDQVIEDFSESETPNIREQVARAMFNKGVRLGQLGRPREAIRVYEQVIQKYKDDNQPILQELVARAMYNKGVRYTKLYDLEKAVESYSQVITSFRGKKEIRIQEQVARAMFNKAMALNKQDKPQEALSVYQSLVNAFKDEKSVILSERVSSASANMAEIELKLKDDVTFDTENSIYKNLDFNNRLKFDMLFILSDAMKEPQDAKIAEWKEKYHDVSMEGYSFEELEKWSDNIDDISIKYRIKEYISTFKSHGI